MTHMGRSQAILSFCPGQSDRLRPSRLGEVRRSITSLLGPDTECCRAISTGSARPGSARSLKSWLGTVMRPSVLRRIATEAGFSGVDVLPIETDFWRFYRLRDE